MSLTRLRERLRVASADERITVAEVDSLIRAAMEDGSVNEMEALLLGSAAEAFEQQFEPAAIEKLREFLRTAPKLPRR